MEVYFLLFLIQANYHLLHGAVQCVDETGAKVDWVIIYKLPKSQPTAAAKDVVKSGRVKTQLFSYYSKGN
jgi:mRNA-degrading endonuclease YafQ of YafQ-DinJ toxin-antitoxin module